jgi:putative toxin-antitoxin system antitoxin component (TIGR02293 family)
MSQVHARAIADLLGLKPRKPETFTALDLAREVRSGLPVQSVERLCTRIAPGDTAWRYRIVPKATLARRRSAQRLSAEEGDRLARTARVWSLAVDVWGSEDAARRFLQEPHPLLAGRVPADVVTETEVGARAVEDLLGRLKYGSAA